MVNNLEHTAIPTHGKALSFRHVLITIKKQRTVDQIAAGKMVSYLSINPDPHRTKANKCLKKTPSPNMCHLSLIKDSSRTRPPRQQNVPQHTLYMQ
jgi:hypothetical protein